MPANVQEGPARSLLVLTESARKTLGAVSFKLSVIRSFFKYLKAAGVITLNHALTKDA
jgi:site-specific recombinase XerD